MKRIPEPELMDSQAQTLAYAEADFSDSNSLFVERFIDRFPGLGEYGRLIDLGCGPADICLRLARKLPGWQVTGLDAGENMLQRAAEAIAAANMQDHVQLRLSYLPDDGLESAAYDAVTSNSLLHHLPNPATLWSTVREVARPGAAVTVMDLRRPESDARARDLVDQYADGAPDILREDFYHSLRAAYTPDEIAAQLSAAGLDHLQIELPSDRHWIASGTIPG
jgi:2-polyprenyl-3-methyl-5-hydroxy-6-metoxy-1,4-benzoquinol methylase